MGSISMLTLVTLLVTIYYSRAMNQVPTTTPRRNRIRDVMLQRSRAGDDALDDVEGNRNLVMERIEKGEFHSQQTRSDDPCRRYQIAKEQKGLQLHQPFPRPRSSRVEQTPSPTNTEAVYDCATGVNAFNALPQEYRTTCPNAASPNCVLLDGWYTCAVAVPKKVLGCMTIKTIYVSLKRCANEIIQQKGREEADRQLEARGRQEQDYLIKAASLAKGTSTPSTSAESPPNTRGRTPGGSGSQRGGGQQRGGQQNATFPPRDHHRGNSW